MLSENIDVRFSRGEYWLLEAVVEALIPICWLVSDEIEELLNKQTHGLKRDEILQTLNNLFSAGLIEASDYDNDDSFILNTEQIESALNEKRSKITERTYYGLTAKGGKYWESFSAPDWNLFLENNSTTLENSENLLGEIICADKKRVEDVFREKQNYLNFKVIPKSIVWDELKSWKATYWKQLPVGYRVRYEFLEPDVPVFWNEIPTSYYFLTQKKFYEWG